MSKAIVFSVLLGFFFTLSHAQEIINLNPKVRIIDGKAFYIHHVLSGQSLGAIARAYVTSEESIRTKNPDLTLPLSGGENIRVPYSDASGAVMSRFDLKLDAELSASVYSDSVVAEKEPERPEQPPLPPAVKKAWVKSTQPDTLVVDDRSIAEAITLLTDEQAEETSNTEELSSEDEEALQALQDLSSNLKTSVSTLNTLRDQVESKPVLAEDGLPKEDRQLKMTPDVNIIPKGELLHVFLSEKAASLLQDPLNNEPTLLKEYFLVRVNPDGMITNVRDERTKMNENTELLPLDSLKGYTLTDTPQVLTSQFQHIGLVVQANYDTVLVKFKSKGMKCYSEGVTEADKTMISEYGAYQLLHGKHEVIVRQSQCFLATYKQVEYNPFGEIRSRLFERSEKRVIRALRI